MASVNIKPLEDKILVQANEAETTTASGLVIPDTAKEKPQEGTVVAVGPGRWDDGAFLRLFLGGVGDDQTRSGRSLGLIGLNEDLVLEWLDVHGHD